MQISKSRYVTIVLRIIPTSPNDPLLYELQFCTTHIKLFLYEISVNYFIVVGKTKVFSSNKYKTTFIQCKNISEQTRCTLFNMDSSETKKGIEIPTEEDMTIMSSRFKEKTEKKDRKKNPLMKTQEQERQSKKLELEMVKDKNSLN